MTSWTFDPDQPTEEPDCPFCGHYMKFYGLRVTDRLHENTWKCIEPSCHRGTLLTLSFTL